MANTIPDIPEWAAQNYRELVEDESRPETYESIAVEAERMDDQLLAAWARGQVDDEASDEDADTGEQAVVYESLKLKDLKALADERDIPTTDLKLRADYIAALEASDAAKAAADAGTDGSGGDPAGQQD